MRKALAVAAVTAALISACAPPIRRATEAPPQTPATFPEQYYQHAIAERKPVYRVDPAMSLVAIEVHRGGSLARFGHDHVVASHDVRGYIAPDEGRADLYVELDRLVVDEPALRAEAGFDTQPSEADIAGTRQNMLDKVLETELHPYALISVKSVDNRNGGASLSASITLHGATHALPIPANIETRSGDVDVTGRFTLNQSDFGIVPFSVLGGAVQVLDQVSLRFRIRGRRVGP